MFERDNLPRDLIYTHGHYGPGILGVKEFSELSFRPSRVFWIYGVDRETVRAKHWHKLDEQYVVCVVGALEVSLESREGREVVELLAGSGMALPTRTWIELSNFSEDCVVLVFSSHPYDPSDCFSDYAEFAREVLGKP